MYPSSPLRGIFAAAWLASAATAMDNTLPSLDLTARNSPSSVQPRAQALRQALYDASLAERDTTYKNSTTITKSFNDAVLFDMTVSFDDVANTAVEISVTCTTCYLSIEASTELVVNGTFNASEAIDSLVDTVETDVTNITKTIANDLVDAFENLTTQVFEGDLGDLQWPTIDLDFDLSSSTEGIPDCQFIFSMDALDLYIETLTNISGAASYSLNLFTSETELGIRISDDVQLGLVLTIDLIMSVDGAIEGDSGFHISIDDGLVIVMDLFGNMSDITFNGGTVEMLPITINSEASFSALLRATLHTGVAMSSDVLAIDTSSLDVSGGIESVVFADLVNVATSIAASNNGSAGSNLDDDFGDDLDDCTLAAEEIYQFALGAGFGASIAVDGHTWGIGPTGVYPVWTSTWSQCISESATATATAATTAEAVRRRADASSTEMETSTISTTITYSAVGCKTTGLTNCPASLQTTAMTTTKSTITTVVPSGEVATWPATTATTVQTSAFGTNAKDMQLSTAAGTASSGASGPMITSESSFDQLTDHLTTKQKQIIIGVCVGVGVPLLTLGLAGIFFCVRRRRGQRVLDQKLYQTPKAPVTQVTEVNGR